MPACIACTFALALSPHADPVPDDRADSAVAVVFELLSGSPPAVGVTIGIDAAGRDESSFEIQPHWASAQGLAAAVRAVEVCDQDGNPLEVDAAENRWDVAHPGAAGLRLRYELHCTQEAIGAEASSYYQALVFEDLFHATGHVALLMPEHLDPEVGREIRVSWHGFAEAGWQTVCSLGSSPELVVKRSLRELASSLFLAGDLRLSEVDAVGGTLAVALYGRRWSFADDEFVELTQEIIAAERESVGGPEQPFYLVSAIPIGGPARTSLGGTGLTDSFALFLSEGWTLQPGNGDRRRIALLLAHELFHHFNGVTVRLAQPEAAGYWFSEGFTDFFCRRILLDAGLLTLESYVEEVNTSLQRLFLSSVREALNTEIRDRFFQDRAVGDLPYHRGHAVARWLDAEIRARSGGSDTLLDLFCDLHDEACAGEPPVDTEFLLARFAEWTSPEFVALLRATIVDGALPEVPAEVFDGDSVTRVEEIPMASFELGFDHPASVAAGRVVGVIEDSAAWRAGLRDGMVTRGYSIYWDRADAPVRLQVEIDGTAREIRYLPAADGPVLVPQLRIGS